MNDVIDDSKVDALHIIWEQSPEYTGPRVVGALPELRVIKDFLSRNNWQRFVQFIVPGVLHHHGRVDEYSGFRFPSDLDPDEEPFDGVEMFDPLATLHISEAAFDRIMSRYFEVIIHGVTTHRHPEIHEGWWQAFVASARAIEQKVKWSS